MSISSKWLSGRHNLKPTLTTELLLNLIIQSRKFSATICKNHFCPPFWSILLLSARFTFFLFNLPSKLAFYLLSSSLFYKYSTQSCSCIQYTHTGCYTNDMELSSSRKITIVGSRKVLGVKSRDEIFANSRLSMLSKLNKERYTFTIRNFFWNFWKCVT